MVLKLKLSKMGALCEGLRKSDGAPYKVREVRFSRYVEGGDADYFMVRMSGELAANAERDIQIGVQYDADIRFDVRRIELKNGGELYEQVCYLRSITPTAPSPSVGGGVQSTPPVQPFDMPL